jgi:hypothetical protein
LFVRALLIAHGRRFDGLELLYNSDNLGYVMYEWGNVEKLWFVGRRKLGSMLSINGSARNYIGIN